MKKRKRDKQHPNAPATISLRDKLMLGVILFLCVGVPLWLTHTRAIRAQVESISKTVQRWKTLYHIDDNAAEQIKQIELDYHGNGSPFTIKPLRSGYENHLHHAGISRLMSEEDGARFMKAMEKSSDSH